MEKTIYSLSTGENIAERAGRARSALAAQTFDCCHEGTRRRLGYVANASKGNDNADLEEKLHNIRKDLVSEFLEQNPGIRQADVDDPALFLNDRRLNINVAGTGNLSIECEDQGQNSNATGEDFRMCKEFVWSQYAGRAYEHIYNKIAAEVQGLMADGNINQARVLLVGDPESGIKGYRMAHDFVPLILEDFYTPKGEVSTGQQFNAVAFERLLPEIVMNYLTTPEEEGKQPLFSLKARFNPDKPITQGRFGRGLRQLFRIRGGG